MTPDTPQRRVVITGMGVITSPGSDLNTFWHNVKNGVSHADVITRFDVSGLPTKIAAQVKNFTPTDYIAHRYVRRYDLGIQYSVCAALAAVKDSEIDLTKMDADRVGVVEATTLSGIESAFRGQTDYTKNGYKKLSPYYLINAYSGGGSGEIALHLGCRGHAISYSSGSASGNDAVGMAYKMIKSDEVDVMVVGGSEAPIMAPIYAGFCSASLMTKRNEKPATSMRPFDKNHDGFLLGEGAAFMVLEEASSALVRNARIYAEIIGHGRSCEAYHSVKLHPEAIGIKRAIEKALKYGGISKNDIDYINAHGTATESNDRVESTAVETFFGGRAKQLSLSGTKPVTGHMLGAAGAVEAVISALAIYHSEIPMTANFDEAQPGCNLDYVTQNCRPYKIDKVLSLNSGFGGKNSCLVFGAWHERT